MNDPIKFIRLGGLFNHLHVLLICLFTFPILCALAIVYGDKIDTTMDRWQSQFGLFMIIFAGLGLAWLIKKVRGDIYDYKNQR